MNYKIPKRIATLYTILLTTAFSLLPLAGAAAPQHNDINKPTRERVQKDKKQDTKKGNDKANTTNKNDGKTTAPKKEESVKPAVAPKKEEPKANDKTQKAEPAKQSAPADTTAKVAEKPKPPTTKNPDNEQFDGIDISKYQGTINWEELKKQSKIKFVYIKATEGTDYVDPRFHENIRNARKHGFKVGSYHFLSTRSAVTTQFYNFIRTAKREDQDLLPVIDVENLKPWSPQQLRDSIKVFADLIEDYYGCKPLIYTSEKFFTTNLGRAFANYPLFIAKYSNTQPNIGYKWILWQFADNGLFKAVKGNGGKVDMSRFAKGCSINDIIYVPSKHKPKNISVKDAVDHKEKPDKVNMTEQRKDPPQPSKRQLEEAQKQAEKDKKAKERNKKLAEEEAKRKAEADKKAQQKAEQQKREKARQQAREAEAKKEAEAKAKRKAEAQKQAEAKAKKEAEEKAKRKAEAQKARQQKAQREANSKTSKTNKTANLMNASSSSKLTQSQRNDSIRNAQYKGRKTNKSSADND